MSLLWSLPFLGCRFNFFTLALLFFRILQGTLVFKTTMEDIFLVPLPSCINFSTLFTFIFYDVMYYWDKVEPQSLGESYLPCFWKPYGHQLLESVFSSLPYKEIYPTGQFIRWIGDSLSFLTSFLSRSNSSDKTVTSGRLAESLRHIRLHFGISLST